MLRKVLRTRNVNTKNKCRLPLVKYRHRRRTFSLTWNGKVENSFITRRLFCRKNSLIKWHNYTHILKSSTIILLPSSPQLNKSYFLSVCPNGNNFVSNSSSNLFFFYHKTCVVIYYQLLSLQIFSVFCP